MKKFKNFTVFIAIVTFLFPLFDFATGLADRLYLAPGYSLEVHTNHSIIKDPNGNVVPFWNPTTIKFAWDWDDTLVTTNYILLTKKLFSHPFFLAQLSFGCGLSFIPCQPFLLGKMYQEIPERTAEDMHYYLKKHHYTALANFMLELGNSSTPKNLMETVVEGLAHNGYEQAIATNKHLVLFNYVKKKRCMQKFISALPQALVVNKNNSIPSDSSIKTAPFKKPDVRYYQTFEQEFNPTQKIVLFIDDKKSNFAPIAQGNLSNWIGLTFVNEKTLIEDFAQLGIKIY